MDTHAVNKISSENYTKFIDILVTHRAILDDSALK